LIGNLDNKNNSLHNSSCKKREKKWRGNNAIIFKHPRHAISLFEEERKKFTKKEKNAEKSNLISGLQKIKIE